MLFYICQWYEYGYVLTFFIYSKHYAFTVKHIRTLGFVRLFTAFKIRLTAHYFSRFIWETSNFAIGTALDLFENVTGSIYKKESRPPLSSSVSLATYSAGPWSKKRAAQTLCCFKCNRQLSTMS